MQIDLILGFYSEMDFQQQIQNKYTTIVATIYVEVTYIKYLIFPINYLLLKFVLFSSGRKCSSLNVVTS